MKTLIAKHKQPSVNQSTFVKFLDMNGFRLNDSQSIMAAKGRLNIHYHDSGFSILGEFYDYPKSMRKLAKIFSSWEPSWVWTYISVYDNEFEIES